MSGPALEVREPSARYFGQDEPALIRGFWLTVTAAGGIATLRATILSLALQGKLVEQRADDESAATLLTAITAEKTRLALSGLVKPGRSGGGTLSAPVELPHGWLMATLADLCVVVTDGDHLPPPKASRGVPF